MARCPSCCNSCGSSTTSRCRSEVPSHQGSPTGHGCPYRLSGEIPQGSFRNTGAGRRASYSTEVLRAGSIPAASTGIFETEVSEESGFSQSVSDPKGRTTHEKVWTGNLKKDGFYITVNTYKGMAALLAIARSLHPASK